jgi:hypothetical protein
MTYIFGDDTKEFIPGDYLTIPDNDISVGDRVMVWHEPRYNYPKTESGVVRAIRLYVGGVYGLYWGYQVLLDRKTKPKRKGEFGNPINVDIYNRPGFRYEHERGVPDVRIWKEDQP